MKFNVGEWVMKPGVTSYNCEQIRQVRVAQDGKSVYLYAVSYRADVRGLDGPSLELTISSPRRDVLRVQACHFRGSRAKMPSFELNDDALTLAIEQNETELRVSSGEMTLEIAFRPCAFRFFYRGKRLTAVGDRFGSPMLSYITTNEGPFMRGQLEVGVGEKVYGLGERFTAFVKNGQTVDIWNEDGGTSSEIAYKNIPFYLTNRGYGVLVNDPGPVSFEVCTEAATKVQFSVPGEKLDFLVIGGGDAKGVLRAYTALTGRPALPPPESFGLWLSSSFTTSYDENTVMRFVDGMAERKIPLSVFHFDCFWMKEGEWCGFDWDEDMFPDVTGLLERLHSRGLKVCVWINPYIGQKSRTFDKAMEKGYLLCRPNGDVWQWDRWQPGCAVYDFTNPECRAWYKEKLKALMRQGVDYFKTDFGERIPTDVRYFDGSDPVRMHNYYTLIYNRVVYEAICEERGEENACLFARSATVGGQQFPVHWGGDCNSTYPSMAESLRGGLSLTLSGFGFWSHDMGGFEGTAPDHVYKRWLAFGLLSTHSRLHGSDSYRVPWLFGDEAVDVCRAFARLKARLMPYLYSLAAETHREGVPPCARCCWNSRTISARRTATASTCWATRCWSRRSCARITSANTTCPAARGRTCSPARSKMSRAGTGRNTASTRCRCSCGKTRSCRWAIAKTAPTTTMKRMSPCACTPCATAHSAPSATAAATQRSPSPQSGTAIPSSSARKAAPPACASA